MFVGVKEHQPRRKGHYLPHLLAQSGFKIEHARLDQLRTKVAVKAGAQIRFLLLDNVEVDAHFGVGRLDIDTPNHNTGIYILAAADAHGGVAAVLLLNRAVKPLDANLGMISQGRLHLLNQIKGQVAWVCGVSVGKVADHHQRFISFGSSKAGSEG